MDSEEEIKYTASELRQIGNQMDSPYDGLEITRTISMKDMKVRGKPIKAESVTEIANPYHIAEYKADYEISRKAYIKRFGSTKGKMYNWMARFLNGLESTLQKMINWPRM